MLIQVADLYACLFGIYESFRKENESFRKENVTKNDEYLSSLGFENRQVINPLK